MRNASIAEWILCRLTRRERAASIVGDLTEIGDRKGVLWFWLSLAGVALSLAWRRPLAFVAALYAGAWTLGEFVTTADSIYTLHYPVGGWNDAFGPLILTGSTLWAAFLYTAIRYGVLDRTTQLLFIWAGLLTTVIYFWWQPMVLGLCIAAALLLALASVFKGSLRKEALVVLVSAAIGSVVRFWAIMLAGFYQYFLGRRLHILWGDREVREHPSLGWVYCGMMVLSLLVATSAWARMYNWLMRSRRLESEVDG
jgi:hypothetical protein